jgi:release factor glutamine methyltransferase
VPAIVCADMNAASAETGPWTVGRLLAWTRDYLQRRAVESPRLCAELLLAHAIGCDRIHLYTRYDAVPDEQVLQRLRAAVREAANGRPVAYLTGTKEFFSLSFEVTPDVLIPRPETEILVERTIDLVRRSGGRLRRILDLGTGSGCIAVSLARNLPEVELFASDISEPALAIARRNAERHGVVSRITFAQGDLFAPWKTLTSAADQPVQGSAATPVFDIIVCNPPYVATREGTPIDPSVRRYEPAIALFAGPDGLDLIRRIVAEAPAWLVWGGHLLLEIAFDQSAKVRALLEESGEFAEIAAYRDQAGHDRVIHARRRPETPVGART